MKKLSSLFTKGSAFAFACSLLNAFLLSGCLTEPKFPIEPEIRFESIRKINIPPDPNIVGGGARDSVIITLHFQDGDGDLGLSQAQQNEEPWNSSKNYVVETLVKRGSTWQEYRDISGNRADYSSNFPPLVELSSKPNPIEGTLDFSITFLKSILNPNAPNDTLMFKVFIRDRALHQSNLVDTEPIAVYGLGQ
jgi:hypothetical protein